MRYLKYLSKDTNPYRNLAIEDYLFRFAEKDTLILYLWQNDNTIVIGRNQDVDAECRREEFLRQDGRIARRKSGGGAVYHDLGNLNFSLIGRKEDVDEGFYKQFILKMLNQLHLEGRFSGKNDIEINGKKISGNAAYDNGQALCQHGTILVCSDISKMTYYLTPQESKLERHAVKSVRSRVMNLCELLPDISVNIVIEAIESAFHTEQLTFEPDMELDSLSAKYESKDWIFGGKQ